MTPMPVPLSERLSAAVTEFRKQADIHIDQAGPPPDWASWAWRLASLCDTAAWALPRRGES